MTNITAKGYKKTLSGSIGAGMGSLFSPGGKKYYILEHKVSSKYHKAGESQEIIVDNIEFGRDSHCQVRFDDSFKTVSRHHAAIIRSGDMWKLVQLSKTNSTFLNGRPIKDEWYLQNGDEIQLSVNGPKIGFITPTGKKSTVGSIGLTRRLSLFRQQALRPYKTAITALSIILVLSIGGLGTWNYMLRTDLKNQSLQLAEEIIKNKDNKVIVDSLAKQLVDANAKIAEADKKINNVIKKGSKKSINNRVVPVPPPPSPSQDDNEADLLSCFPNTYFVQCYIVDENGDPIMLTLDNGKQTPYAWSGTGFLLSNGNFVTAQHVIHVDNIDFVEDQNGNHVIATDGVNTIINSRYYSGVWGIRMIGISSSDKFELTYMYNQNPFQCGKAQFISDMITDEAGRSWLIGMHDYGSSQDWAYVNLGKTGGLPFDGTFSKNMPPKTKLTILGFPANQDITQNGTVSPDVSEAITSRQGLEDNGTIRTSNENADHGNSGGPVLAVRDKRYVVVGILSGANYGSDRTHRKGRIVPIGAAF